MREDDSNWFSKWEEELPSPDDLIPITQTLITPDLAIAFDIRSPHSHHPPSLQHQQQPSLISTPSSQPNSEEFDSPELGGSGGSDEPPRTLKRPRLVWTPYLHKRFMDVVAHLGIKNVIPKTIMQLMSVDGLTHENVSNHLQKCMFYMKTYARSFFRQRWKQLQWRPRHRSFVCKFSGTGSFSPSGSPQFRTLLALRHCCYTTTSTTSPPADGCCYGRASSSIVATIWHVGHFRSTRNGQFKHRFLNRQLQQAIHRVGTPIHNFVPSSYVDDLEEQMLEKF